MPYIFRFHKGANNNIYDWKASDRIGPGHLQEINEKTNILSSSAGTSIPTPLARLFLFKTAFEIMAAQVRKNTVEPNSIYAGLVSETLDLLELLYTSGADTARFRYQRWTFDNSDEALNYFGERPGHRLLATSFQQAASQYPFSQKIDITLIYYKEGSKEVLIGGTSPFTFVFTSPNFKRKMRERGFRPVRGMVSDDVLFDSQYLQLQERDSAFVKYLEQLVNTPGIGDSFKGIAEYVSNTAKRYERRFDGTLPVLSDIKFGDMALMAAQVHLQQVSGDDFRARINESSDFKIALPPDTHYQGPLNPLFLLDKMAMNGQYSSASNLWSSATEVSELAYPENTITDIVTERELPGLSGIRYPFFSSFDFFEPALVRLPEYVLNDQRFLTLKDEQPFLYPIKPLFFHLFPIHRIKEYLSVEEGNGEIRFTIRVPVFGPTKGLREITCTRMYTAQQVVDYQGILGIFPFTRAEEQELLFINQYTVASYEKTNAPQQLESIRFFRNDALEALPATGIQRSNYTDINTRTTYYQLSRSFDIIQLNFKKNNSKVGGTILPLFQTARNGEAEYIYAIDFGTSNTHVEYGKVVDKRVQKAQPFAITEQEMQMYLLNKPGRLQQNDGEGYLDYERSTGTKIDKARLVTLREFIPFQVGTQKSASVRFPFRTATNESAGFIGNAKNNRLFIDANIGFLIDEDQLSDQAMYKTDLKWLLQKASSDSFNINRISLFARELLLMIRTKVLLEESHGNLKKLRIILAFPISMGETLKNKLIGIFDQQRLEVLGADALPLASPVTESIAPYYELKSKNVNIQNDNFCNIDIGGGTTDIVLTKTEDSKDSNQLQCYCSSFRFAGRQLWSSGVNEYQSSDNGFVAYYKHFLLKAQVDNENSRNLERVLNGSSIKTEDIVGLLFSSPEYKFKEIFADKPAFRVVPLIHYAAILFYICRLSTWKQIALPRTVSFSGKGSEYINLLFNDADLKGFTQKMLGIFSGKATRNDFIIEKSSEPKVITARGAVYYAADEVSDEDGNEWGNVPLEGQRSNDKKLRKENVIYKGFRTPAYEERPMSYGELMNSEELYRDLIDNHTDFFNLLFDDTGLVDTINRKLEISNFAQYKRFFLPVNTDVYQTGVLRDSFKATIKGLDPNDQVDDSPFFFALNYALIELSKEIAKTAQI
ncbi:hypothetical protein BEL04_08420 [Mucilaginibacter sp. PPCGB 2223]|uniref:hypothetical protein n=1 Tax=Mucilaginibacter sp. PPCGB 2223 TaxID=1886027 RepID=UPI000825067D|nr:hypothetical protein [Mucilaginibacter sp. PPCGB 2223]OCX54272.1 hypothetical protein BEL04_08420 [Mucilaginibacter sp. PPCGB 2223]